MSIENSQKRILRFEQAGSAIISHDPLRSFRELVDNNFHLFDDFKFIYSTDNFNSDFSHASLKSIEDRCSVLKKFFYGTGLLFFSSSLYRQTLSQGAIQFPIDYSLSLDSNAAEKFRVWENGGSLDKEESRFEQLIRFIKEGKNQGFNFDYSFFIIENLEQSKKMDNHRPFNTLRALKRFDHLIYHKDSFDISNPSFDVDREEAGRKAIETMHSFHSSSDILNLVSQRNGLYLILLKAILLREQSSTSLRENLNTIVAFSLDVLGAFGKTEIYFAWKLLKYGEKYRFFDPINQVNNKSLPKIKGMAWDLFAIRYQETLAIHSRYCDFYIPFFASFDNRFVEFAKACPIRALILDQKDNRAMTLFLDEKEFMEDIRTAISNDLIARLSNPAEKIKRIASRLPPHKLILETQILESKIEAL